MSEEKQELKKANSKVHKKKLNITIIVAAILLLLVCIMGLFAWQGYNLRVKYLQLSAQLQQNSSSIAEQGQTLETTENQLQQIVLLSKRHKEDWVLAEVNYLMHLANINLMITRNVKVAEALLKAVDQRLAILQNANLSALRKAIIQDIAKLQNFTPVDQEGIMLRLENLAEQINLLPLAPGKPVVTAKPQQNNHVVGLWNKFSAVTWARLKNIVILQHEQYPVHMLPSYAEKLYLIQNIRLLLEQAQWAVMHNAATLYQHCLTAVTKKLKQTFAHNLTAVHGYLQELMTLQEININPQMPTLANSISALHAVVIKRKESLL